MSQSPDLNEVRNAIAYITTIRPDLVKQAQLIAQGGKAPTEPEASKQVQTLRILQQLLIVNPEDLHGTVYVSKDTEKLSRNTAGAITIANWINGISNLPLLIFVFQGINPIISASIALIFTGGLLSISNVFGASVAKYKPGNRAWSLLGGFVSLVGINIIQTGATGVGIEILNNRSELNSLYASQLAQDYLTAKENNINKISQSENPNYAIIKERCDLGVERLTSLSSNNPTRDTLYVSLYGTFAQKDLNWNNLPFEKLPICRQVTRLESDKNQAIQTAIAEYQTLSNQRIAIGSDLKFLETQLPNIFREKFDPQGNIKSSTTLVGLATTQVYQKLLNENWSELGLSGLMFAVSAITSFAACVMALTHALSKEVQLSYNQDLQLEIDEYFQELRNALIEAHNNDINPFTPNNSTIQSLEEAYEHDSAEIDSLGTTYSAKSLPLQDETNR